MSHDTDAVKRVLVCIGPDDRDAVDGLVDATIDVVAGGEATVFLLYLFSEAKYEDSLAEMDVDPTSEAITPDELARRQDSVRRPVEELQRHGLAQEIRGVAGGNPSEQVIRYAKTLGVSVAVVLGDRRSPAGKAMFGDYAQQVLLNAECPVLYVKRS